MQYRIIYTGFSWEVQKNTLVNYDGIQARDWVTIRYFYTEKEVKNYFNLLVDCSNQKPIKQQKLYIITKENTYTEQWLTDAEAAETAREGFTVSPK